MLNRLLRPFAFFLLLALLPWPAAGQITAQKVFQNMGDAHETPMDDVETMIVTYRLEGDIAFVDKMTTYYRKGTGADGQPIFETAVKAEGGMADAVNQNAASGMSQADPFGMMRMMDDALAKEAEYRGTETLDGRTVHVVHVEDMAPFYRALAEHNEGAKGVEDMSGSAFFYVDPNGWLLRKMSMETQMEAGGQPYTTHVTMELQDYREVDGLPYPYRMVTTTENPLPPAQREEMRQQMAQLRQQMEGMPPAQREQMEQVIEATLGEQTQMIMVVEDLQVNADLPEGVFE